MLCFLLFRIHLSFYRLSFEQNVLVRSCGQKKVKNILTFSNLLSADAERVRCVLRMRSGKY